MIKKENPKLVEDAIVSENEPIRVKEKNPALKMIRNVFIAIVGIVVILFAMGFLSSLLDIRIPVVDWNVAINKANDVLKPEGDPSNSPTPTATGSSTMTPTVSSTPSATSTPEPTVAPSPTANPNVEFNQDAAEAGYKAGQLFKQYTGSSDDFWRGFNIGAKGE